ncbi:zinc-dependent alcohol dehydrogenase family protein [Pseudomonas sp. TTU2014-080ASC]|uniref:zinc-dependent alcohol dehydrogenase family protein n=1 Tax=Pseudomonas sp. TTU2014-080ASC TaxID=1729724 RepID=UPI000718A740|nr:zinc-dependent alcohol dehydrogenase family protein [Pseudomonas sp. TTU2014-080ASC]KRW58109.1 alcohol dehydrogenase [Pseudomonas sp. TTU2014-080ASC]
MSRVVRFHEFGDPSVLKIEVQPTAPLSADEVLISVDAIGMSWFDVLCRQNLAPCSVTLPSGLGYELAGVVKAVGASVTEFKPGDKVASFPAHGVNAYSCYADETVLPAKSLVRYPETLTPEQAAAHYFPSLVGWFGLVELADLKAGETVLVTAASRGWGPYILQLVKALGGNVIAATVVGADKQWLLNLGADHVIVTDEEDLVGRVNKLTNGRGADVIMDALGGPQMRLLGDAIAVGGRLVLFDLYGGNETSLPACAAFKKNIRFYINMVTNFTGNESVGIPQNTKAVSKALEAIRMLTVDGLLKPCINKVFSFEDVVEAHQYMSKCPSQGRVVLVVGEYADLMI